MATQFSDEPLPGILVDTEMGDVIVVFDITTQTLGVHAPDEMRMSMVNKIINAIADRANEEDEFPFKDAQDNPMVMESDFVWAPIG